MSADLAFIRGKTMRVRLQLRAKNDAGAWVAYDLTGATAVRLQVGPRNGGAALFTLACTVITAASGIVEALFLPAHTASLATGLYSMEPEVEFSATEVYAASFGSGDAEPRLGTLKLIADVTA